MNEYGLGLRWSELNLILSSHWQDAKGFFNAGNLMKKQERREGKGMEKWTDKF